MPRFRVPAVLALAVAGLLAPMAAAQSGLTAEEAVFAGQVGALLRVYGAAMGDFGALSTDSAARWADLAWQNDAIGEAAVFDALREESEAMTPPARFAGSFAELQQAFLAADRAGEFVRQGIEAGSIDTFALAVPEIAAANDRMDAAVALLAEEGVVVAGVPAEADPGDDPSAQGFSADEQAYVDALGTIRADASAAVARYGELTQAPLLTDPAWREEVAAQVTAWDEAYQAALLLEPSEELLAVHEPFVEGLRLYAEAGVELLVAVDNRDVAGLAAAGEKIGDATGRIDAAGRLLDGLVVARGG